jgi:hypothetical protein
VKTRAGRPCHTFRHGLLGCVAAVLLAGCVTTPAKTGDAASAGKNPAAASKTDVTSEPQPSPSPERLTAIEDFLARTQQYRLAPAASASPTSEDAALTRTVAAPEPPIQAPASGPAPQVSANAVMELGDPPISSQPLPALEHVSIRTAPSDRPSKSDAPANHAANLAMRASSERTESLNALIAQWRSDVESKDAGPEAVWRLQLALLLAGREDEARQLPGTFPEDSRAMLTGLVEAAVAVRNLVQDPALTSQASVDRLEGLRSAIALRADPIISATALCSRVLTFGVFDEMAGEEFVAGRSVQTILYSELKHFRSERTDQGRYETRLKTRVEILTPDGRSIWSREEPEIVDTCRSRRNDFFLAQRLTIPPTIPAGEYTIKVYIEDLLARRAAEAHRPLDIVSPVSIAKGLP